MELFGRRRGNALTLSQRRRGLILSLVLSLLLAACIAPAPANQAAAPPDGQKPAATKRVRAAIQGDPWTLSRIMNGNVGRVRGVNELEQLIHAGLGVADDRGVIRAQLAETIPSIENGLWRVLPDGRMETTWRLRAGAAWHDSAPVTSEDLAFTVRVGQDQDLGMFRDKGFDSVEGAVALDARTITVRWSQPYFEADTMFTTQATFAMPLPRHLLERPYVEEKTAFIDLPYWTTEFVGTGPYRVREFTRGIHLLLDANSAYVLGRPKIDEIEVRFIQDLNTLVAHILAGEVELTIGRSLSAENAIQLRERWANGKVPVEPGTSWTALYPQHQNPTPAAIADVRFRRALLHGIDRQELVDVLLYGLIPVAHSSISPSRAEYPDVERAIVRYDHDPRQAAQLLEGLGYLKGTDGFYRDGAGQRLSIEIRSTGGDDFRDRELLTTAGHLQRIGVGVDTVFIARQRATDREYRVTRPGFELVSQGTELRDIQNLHTRAIPTAETRWVGPNRGRYSNPELDVLIDRLNTTIPRAERMGVLADIIRHTTDQLVIMGLYYTPNATAIANRLKNVPTSEPWNSHEWEAE